MFRHPQPHLALSLSVLALAACGESQTPTQPGSEVEAAPSTAVAALTSNTWTSKAAYPRGFGAIGLSAGVVPNASGQSIVYTFGGTDGEGGSCINILAYNVATNTWTSKGPEPEICTFNLNGVGRIGNTLYVTGGSTFGGGSFFTGDNTTWAYNAATNHLTTKADTPKLTAEGVSGVIDGKLFVLPGRCATELFPNPGYCETEPFRRLFRYNPATNFWATKKSAPHVHQIGAGGVINGKFYVAGGRDEASLDAYDPATDTWKTLAPLPVGGEAHGAVLQGKLFVVVTRFVGATSELHAYAYNPGTNTWSNKAAPKFDHPAIVQVTFNGHPALLAVGGVTNAPAANANVSELYTP